MSRWISVCFAVNFLIGAVYAEPARPLSATAKMPVKEVTVFKDGHAFVLRSGLMPVNEAGNVVMDCLPSPVLGTFWPFSAERNAKLSSVTASQQKVLAERTALNLKELIEANIGAEALITEIPSSSAWPNPAYKAIILAIPAQSGEEQEALDPSGSGDKLPQKSDIVLLKTASGIKALPLVRIQDVSFAGECKKLLPREEFRSMLTMKLDWSGREPQKEAEVGLLYLQRGVRWIPSYNVSIDGKGQAVVKLQATLINELADMNDITVNLVIGVPSFDFKDNVDPIALQQTAAQLSPYFQQNSQTAYGLSNAIMTQRAMAPRGDLAESRERNRPADLGPEVASSGRNEDLFIFTVKHVTLRKGQRMVLPINEYTLKYKDIYALDIAFAPPAEIRRNFDTSRQAELAQLFNAPKVMHKIRLFNSSEYPLTTAPALILRDGRVLAQSLMTYASTGSDADLTVTVANDIRVKKSDNEVKRTPNAANWQGYQYGRIDLAGRIVLTNFSKAAIEVEVTRNVLGNVDSAGNNGKIEMVNIFEDSSFASGSQPYWWGWFSWPWWWHHFNGVGRISWTVQLEPGKPLELPYTWNYYWQ